MSELPEDDNLLSPELSTDEELELEEVLREVQLDELYENICAEIAKYQWQIVEERDPKTGLLWHVLISEDGNPLWRANHADKRVAALVVDAFLAGAIQARDEAKEHHRELFEKLERWNPIRSSEIN